MTMQQHGIRSNLTPIGWSLCRDGVHFKPRFGTARTRYCRRIEVAGRLPALALLACLLATLGSGRPAWAADAGVTIQTTLSGSYKGTRPLDQSALAKLGIAEYANADSKGDLKAVLSQLKNGDILILAVHSNPDVVAVGKETVKWPGFWAHFGVADPPKLAAVIIAGCMGRETRSNGETKSVPATAEEVNLIRRSLHANALLVPVGNVHPILGSIQACQFVDSLRKEKKIGDFQFGEKWQISLGPEWDPKGNFTLRDLRAGFVGSWGFRGVDTLKCTINQLATGQLGLITEKGVSGSGRYENENRTTILVDFPFAPGLKGTLTPDRKRLNWSNEEWWGRLP